MFQKEHFSFCEQVVFGIARTGQEQKKGEYEKLGIHDDYLMVYNNFASIAARGATSVLYGAWR